MITIRKVLVTDGESRKALCVVRSLGSQGYEVIVGSNNKINMSRYSKYASDFIHLPDQLSQEKEYINKMKWILTKYNIDVLIPMEDETVELVLENRDMLGTTRTLLPSYDTFMIARDKAKTMKEAQSIGVPIPKTYESKDFETNLDNVEFPVIVKPRISSGSRGIAIIKNKAEFQKKYEDIHKEYESPVVQQYLVGDFKKIQVLVLFNKDHEIQLSCTYQGIREFPVNGGPVTLWKTISDTYIEDKTINFLKNIDWVGFAEVEYVVNRETNEYFLMEINPRFSANISLAVQLGIDYPLHFVESALDENLKCIKNDKYDEYCQWLLPGDILNFIFNKNRFKQKIGYLFNKPKNMHYAVLSKEDIKPSLAFLFSMFVYLPLNLKNLLAKLKTSN